MSLSGILLPPNVHQIDVRSDSKFLANKIVNDKGFRIGPTGSNSIGNDIGNNANSITAIKPLCLNGSAFFQSVNLDCWFLCWRAEIARERAFKCVGLWQISCYFVFVFILMSEVLLHSAKQWIYRCDEQVFGPKSLKLSTRYFLLHCITVSVFHLRSSSTMRKQP